jgi:hypothetical protein
MDIVLVHGVSHAKVFESLWLVVDAINQHPKLSINFPESHDKQMQLANDFCSKSGWFQEVYWCKRWSACLDSQTIQTIQTRCETN